MENVALVQKEPLYNCGVLKTFPDIILCDDRGEMKQSSSVLISIVSRTVCDVLSDIIQDFGESDPCVVLCGYSKKIVHILDEFSHTGCITVHGREGLTTADIADVRGDFTDLGVHTPTEFWTPATKDIKEESIGDYDSQENESIGHESYSESREDTMNNFSIETEERKVNMLDNSPKPNGSTVVCDKNGENVQHLLGPDGCLNPYLYYKFDNDPKLCFHFCPICEDDIPIKTPQDFRLHMKEFHNDVAHLLPKVFTCHKCKRKFDFIRTLFKHMSKPCTSETNYYKRTDMKALPISGVFSDPTTFIKVHYNTDSRRITVYNCPLCKMTFENEGEKSGRKATRWKQHILTYHKEYKACLGKLYECNGCSKKFTAGKYLLHKKIGLCGTSGNCDHCGKHFDSMEKFRAHMENHRYDNFKCNKCDVVLKTKPRLKAHINRYHRDPVTCHHCGKVFKCTQGLRAHILTVHTEDKDKPFHCSICGRGFGRREQMLIHERNHRNEKPYKCRFCAYASSSIGNCWIHEKNVHKDLYLLAKQKS